MKLVPQYTRRGSSLLLLIENTTSATLWRSAHTARRQVGMSMSQLSPARSRTVKANVPPTLAILGESCFIGAGLTKRVKNCSQRRGSISFRDSSLSADGNLMVNS